MAEINIDSTYGMIIIQDLNAVYVDENYARIYGYDSPQDLLDSIDSFLDLIAPDYHEIARQNYKDIISGKMTPRGHTFTNIDRKGRAFTIFCVDHVIEWQGKPALQVTVVDLTPLVEANKQSQENHQNYKNLILHSTQAIILHRDFKPLLVNQSWVRVMRAQSVDFVFSRDSILEIIPPEFREDAKALYQKIITGCVVDVEPRIIEVLCYDGKKRFFNIYESLIDWDGEAAVQVVLEDVTEKVLLEKELLYKATHDQLTDLLNRSAIYDWLEENYQEHRLMGCLLFDIDDFKSINDNYGHLEGDRVIRSFAQVLKQTLAALGVAGRWGGEEFIVFLPELTIKQIIAIAEAVRSDFARLNFPIEQGCFNATVSIGLALSQGKQDYKIDELIKKADLYLYQAKQAGKNTIQA